VHKVVLDARETELVPVGKVSPLGQTHGEHGITMVDQRHIGSRIRLGTRVWLHIGMVSAEKHLGSFNRQRLGAVNELASTIVAAARVTLCVLVRQHAALRVEHGLAHIVFRGDELDDLLLSIDLTDNCRRGFGILFRQASHARGIIALCLELILAHPFVVSSSTCQSAPALECALPGCSSTGYASTVRGATIGPGHAGAGI